MGRATASEPLAERRDGGDGSAIVHCINFRQPMLRCSMTLRRSLFRIALFRFSLFPFLKLAFQVWV
jgi:hypothetical protein